MNSVHFLWALADPARPCSPTHCLSCLARQSQPVRVPADFSVRVESAWTAGKCVMVRGTAGTGRMSLRKSVVCYLSTPNSWTNVLTVLPPGIQDRGPSTSSDPLDQVLSIPSPHFRPFAMRISCCKALRAFPLKSRCSKVRLLLKLTSSLLPFTNYTN